MSEPIKKRSFNPFELKYIPNKKTEIDKIKELKDNEPCVVMACPGMLQSGYSNQLFQLWKGNEKNGVILTGYCVEGSLAQTIQSNPVEGMKMKVQVISFSAHADVK